MFGVVRGSGFCWIITHYLIRIGFVRFEGRKEGNLCFFFGVEDKKWVVIIKDGADC